MKKLLILTSLLLTAGFTLPANAHHSCGQSYYRPSYSYSVYHTPSTSIFISGYRHCGSPIYSKRIKYRNGRVIVQRLQGWELKRYLERKRRIARKRERQRHYYNRSYIPRRIYR